jgi:hypothetical protein
MTVRLFLILLCLAGAVTVGITLTVHQHDRAADAIARDQAERAEAKQRAAERVRDMWRGIPGADHAR